VTLSWREPYLRSLLLILAVLGVLPLNIARAQEIDSSQFSAMQWRLIGPFRAGRVTAVAGVPGHPDTYYFGTPGGGVWKTTNSGQVWRPIFDSQPVASIGALAEMCIRDSAYDRDRDRNRRRYQDDGRR